MVRYTPQFHVCVHVVLAPPSVLGAWSMALGLMAAICTLGFCSFMGYTIFIFSDACPRANCTSKQSCLQNIYMLLYNLSWIPVIMQRFTPVSCFVFEVHLLKLNNDEPN